MAGCEPDVSTPENYRRFAREAAGRSAEYERLALGVAEDPLVLSFLAGLPEAKRQPNLLFGAATYLLGQSPDLVSLRRLVAERPAGLAAVMTARRTQTNEAARCATLLPALAALPQPLALLEVGASAGLTLLVDCYSYDYDGHRVTGTDPRAPTLACHPVGAVPLPWRVPEVAWRAGIDLNPLDAGNADDARWLACLLWPGEPDRPGRLSAALATAARHHVRVHRGDLLDDLADVAAEAPRGATLVVYHSAVLTYVDRPTREAFGEKVRRLGAVWLSNEGPSVLGSATATRPSSMGPGFLLVRDGTTPLAHTDSHGTWLEWLA